MKKTLLPIILIIILTLGIVLYKNYTKDPRIDLAKNPTPLTDNIIEDKDKSAPILIIEKMMGSLKDVTGGSSSGKVVAGFENGEYRLSANFENLPEISDEFFYEGWVVRQEAPTSVISTGKVIDNTNIFTSNKDFTDHTFYVLTLEPDDGDPAPAEHILEGTLGY